MIKEVSVNGNNLKFKIDGSYENVALLLKTYLNQDERIAIAGFYKEHYLVNEILFHVKVKKGDVKKITEEIIENAKSSLDELKIKN